MTTRPAKKPRSPAYLSMDLALGLIVVWSMLAFWLMPELISESYHGNGPGPLNRFFAARSSKKSLDYYLNLWVSFRNSVYLGFISFFLILFCIHSKIRCKKTEVLLIITSAIFLALTILWGPRQDYVAHLKIWDMINSGNDPWWLQPDSGIILNAYGPFFNLLALPAKINPLAPKLFFSTTYLIYCIFLCNSLEIRNHSKNGMHSIKLFLYLFSPFFWLEIAFYGHFDLLVGLLVINGIYLAQKKREIQSGILIALGFLLKFLPVIFLPIIAVRRTHKIEIHWKIIVSSIMVMTSGMIISLNIWGESTFRPLLFASSRGSSLISFWRYIKGPYSPIALINQPVPDLDFLATPLLLMILAMIWLFYLKYQASIMHGSLMVILATLIFYRVGFLQYQMVLFLLLPVWYLQNFDTITTDPLIKIPVFIYFAWITCFDFFDNAVGGIIGFDRRYAWVEDWAGLPHFLCGSLFLIALFRMSVQENAITRNPTAATDHQNAPIKNVK